MLIVLGSLTWKQAHIYWDAQRVWQDTIAKNPRCWMAHNNLGFALVQLGRIQEGIGQYEQVLQIKPDYAEAHNNLGFALVRLGKAREAIGHYEQALRIKPDYAEAHNNLGVALEQAGRVQEAIGHYEQALRITPDYAPAHYNLGSALGQAGKAREAIKHYEEVLRIKPDSVVTQNNLAWLLATHAPEDGGNPAQGLGLAQRACELTHNRVAPYLDTLAAAYAATGQFSNAVAIAQKAIELARAAQQPQVVEEIQMRLELYRSGVAYRQSVGGTSPRNP
jgi:tetratricopeptide (TPR) repeat protein